MAYRHDQLLNRHIRDHSGTREEAERCFIAMKQFLAVCSVIPGKKVAAEEVDDLWHTFLLFTRDYQDFCDEYLGRFIHHDPNGGFASGTYESTRALAEELFSNLDERFWPAKARIDCEGSGASSGCGG
jgi:hypothetical protein